MFNRFLEEHSFFDYSFKSDIFPDVTDRAFWDAFPDDDCTKKAEAALDYRWPVILATDFMAFRLSGDRKIMENPHFDRRNHLTLFALAELKENQGRFLPQIVNGLFAISEETYWGLSAHWPKNTYELGNIQSPTEPYIDLFAAETAEHLAMITAMLKEPLKAFCPEILDRVKYELERRIIAPYLAHRDWGWMGYHKRTGNWNPWILSNLLTVYLLSDVSEHTLHRALKKMFTEIGFYYDSLPADGGCDEGPSYWDRAGASLFEFIYQLKVATDGALDLFADEKLGLIAAYMKKVHMVSDLFVNVADAHAKGHDHSMPLLYLFARETKQKPLMNFSAAVYIDKNGKNSTLSHTSRTVRRLVYNSIALREMATYKISYPLHGALECLPQMELAVLRAGNLTLSAKGGFNSELHNHNDVGSFTLYDKTTPVLVDVGINTYTRFTFQNDTRYTVVPWPQAKNHNIPLVNGVQQPFGYDYRADAFSATADEVKISFAGAYPAEAGVDALTRTLTLDENGMTCTDRFTFTDNAKSHVTEVLMSVLPVEMKENTVIIGNRYRISASVGRFSAEYLPFNDANLESDWKSEGVTRITLDVEGASEVRMTVEML